MSKSNKKEVKQAPKRPPVLLPKDFAFIFEYDGQTYPIFKLEDIYGEPTKFVVAEGEVKNDKGEVAFYKVDFNPNRQKAVKIEEHEKDRQILELLISMKRSPQAEQHSNESSLKPPIQQKRHSKASSLQPPIQQRQPLPILPRLLPRPAQAIVIKHLVKAPSDFAHIAQDANGNDVAILKLTTRDRKKSFFIIAKPSEKNAHGNFFYEAEIEIIDSKFPASFVCEKIEVGEVNDKILQGLGLPPRSAQTAVPIQVPSTQTKVNPEGRDTKRIRLTEKIPTIQEGKGFNSRQ